MHINDINVMFNKALHVYGQTDRQTDRQTDTQTHTHTHTHRCDSI